MVKDLLFLGGKFAVLSSFFFVGTSYAFSFLPEKKDSQGHKRSWVLESVFVASALTILFSFTSCKRNNELEAEKNKQINNPSSATLLVLKKQKAVNSK